MKFYAALLAVLMVGIAVGQTGTATAEPTCRNSTCTCAADGKSCEKPKPAPKRPTERKPAHGPIITVGGQKNEISHNTFIEADSDPLDVPAIQETRKTPADECRMVTPTSAMDAMGTLTNCLPEYKVWTCAEKSRILEHDESTPAKYWCRKVQQ